MATFLQKHAEALRKRGETVDAAQKDKRNVGELSQWQLIRLRFKRHWLAVFSLFVLVSLYLVVIFCEIVAPVTPGWRNLDYMNTPPQLPKFSMEHGWHVDALRMERDPATFRHHYVTVPDTIVPLCFFARGEPYRLWGLFEWDRHLLGVDHRAIERGEIDPDLASFYFMGADKHGHDIFSRIVYGARVSLSIGMLAIVVTAIFGILIGGVSGYLGGRVDEVIQRTIEIINSFPQLPLWLALAAIMPADWPLVVVYFGITMVLSLLGWTGLARVVRGKILSLREEDYAIAARLLGAGHGRVLFRHLVPGFTSHIIVVLTLSVPAMILGETALSFLGLGLRPPVVSWGVMLQDAMHLQAVANYPWILLPVVPIIVTVLAFNFLGDGLRDAADPYSGK